MNQIHHQSLPRRKKRTEQIKNMLSLHVNHKMGYLQIADQYGSTEKEVKNAVEYYKRKNA